MNSRITNNSYQLVSVGEMKVVSLPTTSISAYATLPECKYVEFEASVDAVYRCDATPVSESEGFTISAKQKLIMPFQEFKKLMIAGSSAGKLFVQAKDELA